MNPGSIATVAFVVILVILTAFQVALAAGAPFGGFAWGGQHRVLPRRMRMGSAASVVVYAVMALLALDRTGLVDLLPDVVSGVVMWVVFGYLVLSIVPNLLTKSPRERAVMVPVTTLLAVLALVIAIGRHGGSMGA